MIQGKEIEEYLGIVLRKVVTGINFMKDIGAGLRDIFEGRSKGYGNEIIKGREESI